MTTEMPVAIEVTDTSESPEDSTVLHFEYWDEADKAWRRGAFRAIDGE